MGCDLTSVFSAKLFSKVEEPVCVLTRSYSGMVLAAACPGHVFSVRIGGVFCFSFYCMGQSCGINGIVSTLGMSELKLWS